MKVSSLRLATVFALALGLWHAGWAALVALGLAQPLLNWIFELHFLSQPFQVQPFNMITAATLVGVTAGVGFVVGLLVGLVWNAVYAGKPQSKG